MKKVLIPCVLLLFILLGACTPNSDEKPDKGVNFDSAVLWPAADYEVLPHSEKIAYQNAVRAQLDYDEYVCLPGEDGPDIVESWSGTYFLFAEDAQKLYPDLDFTQEIGAYRLAGIAVESNPAVTFSPEDMEYYKVYKRRFHSSAVKSVSVTYLSDEEGFQYREFYGTTPEEVLSRYVDSRLLTDLSGTWLCTTVYDTHAVVREHSNTYCTTVTQGERFVDPFGFICIAASPENTAAALEEILPTTALIRPINPVAVGREKQEIIAMEITVDEALRA